MMKCKQTLVNKNQSWNLLRKNHILIFLRKPSRHAGSKH